MVSRAVNELVIRCFLIGVVLSAAPSAFAWTTHRSFEDGALGAVAVGSDAFDSDASGTSYTNEVVASGAQAARLSVRGGTAGFGYWGGIIRFPNDLQKGDELWVSMRIFIPNGFQIDTDTGSLKFLRIRQKNLDGSHTGYLDNLIREPDQIKGVFTLLKEGQNKLFHYGVRGVDDLSFGKWIRFELYAYLDDVATDEGGRGLVRAWVDDTLVTQQSAVQTLSNAAAYATSLYVFTYWNGGAPKDQNLFVDDIVITNDLPMNRDAVGNPMIGDVVDDVPGAAPPSSPSLSVDS